MGNPPAAYSSDVRKTKMWWLNTRLPHHIVVLIVVDADDAMRRVLAEQRR
jgi:hypothetical protein